MRDALPAVSGLESALDDANAPMGPVGARAGCHIGFGTIGVDTASTTGSLTRDDVIGAALDVREALLARLALTVPRVAVGPWRMEASSDGTARSGAIGRKATTEVLAVRSVTPTEDSASDPATTLAANRRLRDENVTRMPTSLDELGRVVGRLESVALQYSLPAPVVPIPPTHQRGHEPQAVAAVGTTTEAVGVSDAPRADVRRNEDRRRVVVVACRFAGIALILLVIYALFGTAVVEGRAQRSMSAQSHVRVTSPDTGLDSLVVSSDSRRALQDGPGFVPGFDVPGGTRPVMIVGHRVGSGAPFRHLSALKPGTRVTLRRGDGPVYVYAVERTITATPHGRIVEQNGTQALLLVSATPPYHDSRRLVVIARLIGGPQAGAQTTQLPGLGGAPLNLATGVALLLLLSIAWGVWRVRVQPGAWWAQGVALLPTAVAMYAAWAMLLGAVSRVL